MEDFQNDLVQKMAKLSSAIRSGLSSNWEVVTPDRARALLAMCRASHEKTGMAVNRSVADHTVAAYARDMMNDKWEITHQGIAIEAETGLVIDGQHRLEAIIRSNTPQIMLVTIGVPGASKLVMDRGRVRSVADALRLANGDAGINRNVVATAKSMAKNHRWFRASVNKMTSVEIYYVFEAYKDLLKEVCSLTGNTTNMPSGYRAAVVGALYNHPGQSRWIHKFVSLTKTGIPLSAEERPLFPESRVPFLLKKKIAEMDNNWEKDEKIFQLTEHAIKLYIEGQDRKELRMAPHKDPYFPMPTPYGLREEDVAEEEATETIPATGEQTEFLFV